MLYMIYQCLICTLSHLPCNDAAKGIQSHLVKGRAREEALVDHVADVEVLVVGVPHRPVPVPAHHGKVRAAQRGKYFKMENAVSGIMPLFYLRKCAKLS